MVHEPAVTLLEIRAVYVAPLAGTHVTFLPIESRRDDGL
jgi:hypothetical protein